MKIKIIEAGNASINGIFLKAGVTLTLTDKNEKSTIAWLEENKIKFEEVKAEPEVKELTDATVVVEEAKELTDEEKAKADAEAKAKAEATK